MDFINEEIKDFKSIFNRFKRKDFSGTSGQAIKNSSFQLMTNLFSKIGSLIFVFLLARILGPEIYGAYTSTLAIVLLFLLTGDLGIGQAIVKYISEANSKKKFKKSKAYYDFLISQKMKLIIFSCFNLAFSIAIFSLVFVYKFYLLASFLALIYLIFSIWTFRKINFWKNFRVDLILSILFLALFIFLIWYTNSKSLFYFALLSGIFYIFFSLVRGFFSSLFNAQNDFKSSFYSEMIFQGSRILITLPLAFWAINNFASKDLIVFSIISLLSLSYLLSLAYLIFKRKTISFLNLKKQKLPRKEQKDIKKFILPLSAIGLSGIFFGYIDILMLKHYVQDAFIGYYSAAFSLIGSATAIIGFAGASLLPIFSGLKKKSLNKIFNKTKIIMLGITSFSTIFTFIFAKYLVLIIYGSEYYNSIILLKCLSVLVFILPFIAIYTTYFISKKETSFVAKLVIIATVLNIVFNFIGITYGLRTSMLNAVIGACIATILSRIVYLVGFFLHEKKII